MLRDRITDKLAARLREDLMRHGVLHIDGLGTFKRVHHPAEEQTQPDGTIILHPPKYEIRFLPEGDNT